MQGNRKKFKIVGALILVCIIAFPIYWMLVTSLKTKTELLTNELSLFPQKATLSNYLKVIKSSDVRTYLFNSIFTTTIILISQIITGTLAAYWFAKTNSKFKNLLFIIVMGAMMIPIQITFIPIYIEFAKYKLVNTYLGIILPEIASPFLIYMLKNSFESTNKELAETGEIDCLSNLQLLRYVYIPENKGKFIATVFILFVNSWNSYFWPKIIVNNKTKRVLSVGIAFMKTAYGGDAIGNYNEIMAASILAIIPVIILFIKFQKYINNVKI